MKASITFCALVALAFLFSIFRSRPSPFYLLDEVEAALDDFNLQRFIGLIRQAEQDVEQQAAVVAALKLQGHNSDDAKNLLGAYTDEVDRHRADLDRLLEGPEVMA